MRREKDIGASRGGGEKELAQRGCERKRERKGILEHQVASSLFPPSTFERRASIKHFSPSSFSPPLSSSLALVFPAINAGHSRLPLSEAAARKKKKQVVLGSNKKESAAMADLSDLLAEKLDLDLDLDLDAPGGASSSSSSSSSSTAAPVPLKLTDVPNQVLVSIFFVAAEEDSSSGLDSRFPLSARPSATSTARATLRRSTSVLLLDFAKEVAAAKKTTPRRSSRREPVVRASRVLSWARRHAESVRELHLNPRDGASLGDFNATNFAQLVASVGPHLTEIGSMRASKSSWGPLSGQR